MGKWNLSDVPQKGWECVTVIDLGDDDEEDIPYEQCEMCGNEKIRYVHVVRHPEWPDELRVGCVCAQKMTDDYVNPCKIEKELKNKAQRRTNFNKVKWKYNPEKDTYSKRYKGEYITIVKSRYGTFGIFFADEKIWNINGKK